MNIEKNINYQKFKLGKVVIFYDACFGGPGCEISNQFLEELINLEDSLVTK